MNTNVKDDMVRALTGGKKGPVQTPQQTIVPNQVVQKEDKHKIEALNYLIDQRLMDKADLKKIIDDVGEGDVAVKNTELELGTEVEKLNKTFKGLRESWDKEDKKTWTESLEKRTGWGPKEQKAETFITAFEDAYKDQVTPPANKIKLNRFKKDLGRYASGYKKIKGTETVGDLMIKNKLVTQEELDAKPLDETFMALGLTYKGVTELKPSDLTKSTKLVDILFDKDQRKGIYESQANAAIQEVRETYLTSSDDYFLDRMDHVMDYFDTSGVQYGRKDRGLADSDMAEDNPMMESALWAQQ